MALYSCHIMKDKDSKNYVSLETIQTLQDIMWKGHKDGKTSRTTQPVEFHINRAVMHLKAFQKTEELEDIEHAFARIMIILDSLKEVK